jgi:hypothetical protein
MSDERRSKDQRQWARFPIDMHLDAKIVRLDVAVRWTFVEMNFEARREANDGVFGKDDAEFRWPVEHLTALCKSHPSEPLVIATKDTYVLRRYAQHQFTEADRAELKAKRAQAGAKGGKATALAKQTAASGQHLLSKGAANPSKPQQTAAESESEVETDRPRLSQSCQETLPAQSADKTDQLIPAIISEIRHELGIDATADEARHWARYVIGHAKTPPRNPKSYLLASLYNSRDEQADWFAKHRRHLKAVGNG